MDYRNVPLLRVKWKAAVAVTRSLLFNAPDTATTLIDTIAIFIMEFTRNRAVALSGL